MLEPLIDIVFVLDKKGENILFCFISSLYWFFVLNKKERRICFYCFVFNPFVDDWQKGREEFVVYMHVLYACFMFLLSSLGIKKHYWYQEFYLKNMFIFGIKNLSLVLFCNWYHELVSRACFENVFVLFNWYQKHVDAYMFMNIHCIFICLSWCMS